MKNIIADFLESENEGVSDEIDIAGYRNVYYELIKYPNSMLYIHLANLNY